MRSPSNDLCLLGVDGGTESLRAGVFDLHGALLASASTAYETRFIGMVGLGGVRPGSLGGMM